MGALISRFKVGQTIHYMYMNWPCSAKVSDIKEKDGSVYYNDEVLEKYAFKNKKELIDFHAHTGKSKKYFGR
jgi:hypothetical protein